MVGLLHRIPSWSAIFPSNREQVILQKMTGQTFSHCLDLGLKVYSGQCKFHIKMDRNMACSTAWVPAVLDVCSYKDAERGFPQSILSLSSQNSGEARAGCAGAFLILFTCFHPTPQNRLRSKDRPHADSYGQI